MALKRKEGDLAWPALNRRYPAKLSRRLGEAMHTLSLAVVRPDRHALSFNEAG